MTDLRTRAVEAVAVVVFCAASLADHEPANQAPPPTENCPDTPFTREVCSLCFCPYCQKESNGTCIRGCPSNSTCTGEDVEDDCSGIVYHCECNTGYVADGSGNGCVPG